MAQKQRSGGNGKRAETNAKPRQADAKHADDIALSSNVSAGTTEKHGHQEWFGRFAHEIARLSGKPAAFILATAAVVIWGLTGPLFNYSDTWQLVINTSTTIVTFLMVFLIQSTQNRDTMALQIKLSELIIAMHGAQNRLAAAEDLSEEELEQLHKEYCGRAESTREHLEKRRAAAKK
jgi:low affinity Fe/Cu permease